MAVRWLRLRQTQVSWALLLCLSVSLPPSGKIYRFRMGWSFGTKKSRDSQALLWLDSANLVSKGSSQWPRDHVLNSSLQTAGATIRQKRWQIFNNTKWTPPLSKGPHNKISNFFTKKQFVTNGDFGKNSFLISMMDDIDSRCFHAICHGFITGQKYWKRLFSDFQIQKRHTTLKMLKIWNYFTCKNIFFFFFPKVKA